MPKGSKIEKAETALKASARKEGIRNKGAYVYGTLNEIGLMRGNKPTARGRQKASKGK